MISPRSEEAFERKVLYEIQTASSQPAAVEAICEAHNHAVTAAEVALLERMPEDERGNREAGYQTSRGWFIKWADSELKARREG